MAYQFTTSEIAQLRAARLLCPEGNQNPTSTGNWAPFYQAMSDILETRIDDGMVS